MLLTLGTSFSKCRRAAPLVFILAMLFTALAWGQKRSVPSERSSPANPLRLESLLEMNYFSDLIVPAISPDNDYVAYTIIVPNRAGSDGVRSIPPAGYTPPRRSEVWVYSVRTRANRRISAPNVSASAPVWSHDGTAVAFYCDERDQARICVWHLAEGDLQILGAPVAKLHRSGLIRWSADDRAIITLLVHPLPAQADGSPSGLEAVHVFESDPGQSEGEGRSHEHFSALPLDLGLINSHDGTTKRLLLGGQPIRWFTLSADGSRIAVCIDRGELTDAGNAHRFEIRALQLDSGADLIQPQQAVMFYAGSTISWSGDGRYLAWIAQGHCWLASIDDDHIERITSAARYSANFEPPFWDQDDNVLLLEGNVGDDPTFWSDRQTNGVVNYDDLWRYSPNTHVGRSFAVGQHSIAKIIANQETNMAWQPGGELSIYLLTQDRDSLEEGFARLDTSTGESKVLRQSQQYLAMGRMNLNASRSGKNLVFTAEDIAHPADLWAITNVEFSTAFQITDLNPAVAQSSHGRAQLVRWRNPNGHELRGVVLLPPNSDYSRPYPLITWVYGGSAGSQAINQYGMGTGRSSPVYNLQLLASRGYAVFYPDIPLSTGSPMAEIPEDVLSGVNHLIDLGIADGKRLALWGQSYGGYSVLATLVRSSRFKAAIAAAGLYDLSSLYGLLLDNGTAPWIPYAESGQGRIGLPLWDDKSRYIENSPWFYLDRVRTPLLIECGMRDVAACLQSDQLFVGLRRLQRTAELRKYPDEGHEVRGHEHQIDYWQTALAWFQKYLASALTLGGKTLNPAAFSVPATPRQGNEARNDIPGFGLTQVELSMGRDFRIRDRVNLKFRTDAFNMLNHPNFANPLGYVEFGPTYMQSIQMLNQALGGLNPLFQEGGPRSPQLSLKLTF